MTAARRARKDRLYSPDGKPTVNFNPLVRRWLDEQLPLVEHNKPAAFDGIRAAYQKIIQALLESGVSPREAHRKTLSALTQLMFGHDLTEELRRLAPGLINVSGFRTTLAQGFAKNIGENFVNLLVYAFSLLLEHQDEVLVDKGLPPLLKSALTLHRDVRLAAGTKTVNIVLEGDMTIFSRSDPSSAIVLSAKTRLKERP